MVPMSSALYTLQARLEDSLMETCSVRAVDKAYRTVRNGIIAGRYSAGARITEQEIAAASGVSRTPVREALRKLQSEGLVDFTPNFGAVVTVWNEDDADEVFQLRALLESHGARRAAHLATPQQLVRLRELAEAQYRESLDRRDGYLDRIGEINNHFHHALQDAANSPRLKQALSALIEAPLVMKTFYTYTPDDLIRSAQHHLELCSALESRDAEWAASVISSHIHAARGSLRR
jgi:DNA-binding GntR family transcriptional regulator